MNATKDAVRHVPPLLFLLLGLFISLPALANKASIEKGGGQWSFDIRWTDAAGQAQRARFQLPANLVKQDLEEPVVFRKQKASQYAAEAIRSWSKGRKGPKVSVSVSSGEVRIAVKGKSRSAMKQALAEAQQVGEAAQEEWLEKNGFVRIDEDTILPDHAGHVAEYAPSLAPVVEALGGPGADARSFAELALGFVQTIPYEKRALVSDRYRRPLSLLGRNKGDCDSKSVLFLGLMRQAWPELPLAMVYIKGHAFVALGLEPQDDDRTVEIDDVDWVGAEPVGPALNELGELGKTSRRKARRGRYETLQVP